MSLTREELLAAAERAGRWPGSFRWISPDCPLPGLIGDLTILNNAAALIADNPALVEYG